MPISPALRHFVTLVAIAAVPLAGCGGPQSVAMPNAAQVQSLIRDTSDIVPLVKVAAPFVKIPQPPGASCVAAKINNANNLYFGVMNCSNGLAYDAEGNAKPPAVPPVVVLNPPPPPPGAGAFTGEKAFDVDQRGNAVGY